MLKIVILSILMFAFNAAADFEWSTTTFSDGSYANTYDYGPSSITSFSDGTYANTYEFGNSSTTFFSDGTYMNSYDWYLPLNSYEIWFKFKIGLLFL